MSNKIKIRAFLFAKLVKTASGDNNDGPNFDYGKGLYSNINKYKSIKDFEEHADKGPGAFFADDNDIDFPIDDQINSPPIVGNSGSSYVDSIPISYQEDYTAEPDQDGKGEATLDFGYDLTNEDEPVGRDAPHDDEYLDALEEKYLRPAETDIYGLPDGVDPEGKDADQTISTENPDYGITDSGRQMYEDKWNI